MMLTLSNIGDLNKLYQDVVVSVRSALQPLEKNLEVLAQYLKHLEPAATISFSPAHEIIINQLSEIARIAGASCVAEGEDRGTTFRGSMITSYEGSLFIVGPAGFAKQAFADGMSKRS
jgi:hypothetical protein